jgi:CO/xanthine dehydrogenase FAD-binding subunit
MLVPFHLYEPATLTAVQDLLLRYGPGARVLAGGTDLLPNLERRRVCLQAVLALPALPELRGVQTAGDGRLRLGALVTLAELAASPLLRAYWPILADTAAQMATPQVRHLATLGGNLCAGLPAADLVVVLLALDALIEIQGLDGSYTLSLDQWLAPWGVPRLQSGELVRAVHVLPFTGHAAYQRFGVRAAADVVLANVAVRIPADRDGVRIVVGAHGLRPARAAAAETMLANGAAAPVVAEAAAVWACLPDDRRASRAYRQALVRVLVLRALASRAEVA